MFGSKSIFAARSVQLVNDEYPQRECRAWSVAYGSLDLVNGIRAGILGSDCARWYPFAHKRTLGVSPSALFYNFWKLTVAETVLMQTWWTIYSQRRPAHTQRSTFATLPARPRSGQSRRHLRPSLRALQQLHVRFREGAARDFEARDAGVLWPAWQQQL